ncbi:polysaccharide lyase 8 family protein [Actinopolymorpha alba]|uniref:polysaccharide lyase 8 family protein n=1 Tax=Actinopolymorpha alba TaxID=533267 RepID=UPI000360D1B4|nr:polysaccharide lyase 8 family protein [Actinopolymorpha alba]
MPDHHANAVPPRLPRRLVLGATAATLLSAVPFDRDQATAATGPSGGPDTAAGDTFDALRETWVATLTGGDQVDPTEPAIAAALRGLDAAVQADLGRIVRTPHRDRVFNDQSMANDAQISNTLVFLARMATAWATRGSRFHADEALLADTLAGLETVNQFGYYAGRKEFGNWWSWEIGASRALADAMCLLHDHIPADAMERYAGAIDWFVPDPWEQFPPERGKVTSTGANRVDLCQAVAVRGIATKDAAKVTRARDGLVDVWQYVTTGDGFYRDGSFVQHTWVAYTGTYGNVLLGGLGKLLALFAGSAYEITDPSRQILFDAVEQTFAPVIHDARMMDFVRGRGISRYNASDHGDGYATIEAILRMADGVEPSLGDRWRARVAGWLDRDTFSDILASASLPRAVLVTTLQKSGIAPVPEPAGHHLFPSMARSVHRRPGWAYAISMASKRISYYECGNGENDRGYHTGSGMTYLYDGDNGQYADEFWPTVDLTRLPGITVDTKPLPNRAGGQWGEARPPTATWVGGATLDGYATVGQHLEAPVSPLVARKSWFCLDEYVIALGAGITGSSGHRVETIVENRNLHADGTNRLAVNGATRVSELGSEESIDGASWAHLDGVGGFLVPGGGRLKVRREARTGAWRDIHQSGPITPITRRYLTMWFDHGVDPSDASYAYVVVPGATPRRTTELARDPGFQVLANSSAVQAVWAHPSGVLAANFWRPGGVRDIQVDAPCAVLVRERRGTLTLAVSDPTQDGTTVTLSLDRHGFKSADADPTVTVLSVEPTIRLRVDVHASAGASHRVRFTR